MSIGLPTPRCRDAKVAGPKYLRPDVKDEDDGNLQHELQQLAFQFQINPVGLWVLLIRLLILIILMKTLTRIVSNLNCGKCSTYRLILNVVFEINMGTTRRGENQHKKYSGRILLPDLCQER